MTSRTSTATISTAPLLPAELGEELATLETLIDLGDRDGARRLARRLMDRADPATCEKLADLVSAAEDKRDSAYIPPRPVERWEPASRVAVGWEPPRPRDRRTARTDGQALTDSYGADRAGVDDCPDRSEPLVGYELDYDLAALAPMRGHPCLNCRIERSDYDRRNPDGLCRDCRDDGHTRESVIEAWCELVANGAGERGRARVQQAWRKATRDTDKKIIENWAKANGPRHDWQPPAKPARQRISHRPSVGSGVYGNPK